MTTRLLKLNVALCLFLPVFSFAQITVTDLNSTTISPTSLVSGFVGSGIQVVNVTQIGDNAQLGYFQGANSTGVNAGIVLSSGAANDIIGPNSLSGTTTNFNGPGDGTLANIATGPTNDAAGLEITFIPLGGTVTFNYSFASEEYPEWVNSGFNDVFGFFISGPGLSQQNIALIPGTTTPVSINSVNATSNSAYYVDNTAGTDFEYDGHTTVLSSTITLVPNQTYTLKLVVADVSDHVLDSGVLLEVGSFSSSFNGMSYAVLTPDLSGEIHEGCANGSFNFILSDTLSNDTTVHFSIIGTAQNGMDYFPIPDSITIPAGQQVGTLPIVALEDGIIEGLENVSIVVDAPFGGLDTFSIQINEPNYPTLLIDSATACTFDSLVIGFVGGDPGSYQWTPDNTVACSTCQQTPIFPTESTTYIGTYTSLKGCTLVDTVMITIGENTMPYNFICTSIGLDSLELTWQTSATSLSSEISINGGNWMPTNNGLLSHVITPIPAGGVDIEVRCENNCNDIYSDTTSTCNNPVSTESIFERHDLSIYPNPVNDVLQINWNFPQRKDIQVELLATDGRLIQSQIFGAYDNITLSTENLPNGIYLLRLVHESEFIVKRIVVAH